MPVTTLSDFALDPLLDRAVDGLFVLDGDRRFVMFNAGFRRITGYASEDILGTQCQCHNALDCRDAYGRTLAGSLCPGLSVFRGNTPVGRQRMQIRRKDGATTWVETAYTPIQNESGAIECVLGIMRDVSETQEREDILREAVSTLRDAVSRLRADLAERYGFNNIVTRSPRMREVFDRIQAAATHDRAVLITGEAGTGKEMAARAIHAVGLQKDGPFVAFNCSAVPTDQIASQLFGCAEGACPGSSAAFKGWFQAAENGTLFIDEILEMPPELQAQLLGALENGRVRPVGGTTEVTVNARVVSATSRGVTGALRSGRLRQDLHYRLGVTVIELPPLRERRQDIPVLVAHRIEQCNAQSLRQIKEVDARVWDLLLSYGWPGNVRELQNAVDTAFTSGQGETLSAADLPASVRNDTLDVLESMPLDDLNLDDTLRRIERKVIEAALSRAGRQRSRAAQLMGISRSRLYRRMEALGVDPNQES